MPDLLDLLFANPILLVSIGLGLGLVLITVAVRSFPKKQQDDHGLLTGCNVATIPLMSVEQGRVYDILAPYAAAKDLNLHAEVSLSAIFKVGHPSDRKRAFAGFGSIRQKRLDLLLTDRNHRPVCGVEYHGSGHWRGNARQRDHAKRTAFNIAGLPLIEVAEGIDSGTLVERLDAALAGLDLLSNESPRRRRGSAITKAA